MRVRHGVCSLFLKCSHNSFSTPLIQWRSQVFDPGCKKNFVTNPPLSQFFAKTPSVPQPRPLPPGTATVLITPHTLFSVPYNTYYLTRTTELPDKWPWTPNSTPAPTLSPTTIHTCTPPPMRKIEIKIWDAKSQNYPDSIYFVIANTQI